MTDPIRPRNPEPKLFQYRKRGKAKGKTRNSCADIRWERLTSPARKPGPVVRQSASTEPENRRPKN